MHEKLKSIMRQSKLSQYRLAHMANVPSTGLNQAINGKLTFFPGWRKRVAIALNMPEDEVFPEYAEKKEAQ